MVAQIGPRWNRLAEWLRQAESFKKIAHAVVAITLAALGMFGLLGVREDVRFRSLETLSAVTTSGCCRHAEQLEHPFRVPAVVTEFHCAGREARVTGNRRAAPHQQPRPAAAARGGPRGGCQGG